VSEYVWLLTRVEQIISTVWLRTTKNRDQCCPVGPCACGSGKTLPF